MMKIVLIGATGTIGQAVAGQLAGHEVIKVAHAGGDFQVDIGDPASIKALFEQVGEVDAIVSTAGLDWHLRPWRSSLTMNLPWRWIIS